MGSHRRSIRLRIYSLVAIPLITMLGLFSYVAYTSVNNWLNLDRAPNLIRATSVPLTNFVSLLQAERRAAVVYLSNPDAANHDAFQSAITATTNGEMPLAAALNSEGTKNSTTPAETAAINKMNSDVSGMAQLRGAVQARKLKPLDALGAYTKVISDQDIVFQAEAHSLTNATATAQGLGLISAVNAREEVSEQDAVLAGALARGSLTGPDRVAFSQATGRQQDDTLLYTTLLSATELKTFNTTMNAQAPARVQSGLVTIQQAVAAGTPLGEIKALGLSPASWQQQTKTWQRANYDAATDAADATIEFDQGVSNDAKTRVWETGAIGALGLILTLIVTITLGRSINRRLTVLRRSALTLAEEQLPAVVARLRRGENVDAAAEAPAPLGGRDEIGQVGQAIEKVRQTAILSAVEEARLRQGVNDVFRNLARRNQSLLQRQLSVLDGMERKATDPDVLDDLFKMDHLTTRMRRHAEGLIILSGAAPGRAWSAPVKLIDVMRGAVSEVEDYARVVVSTQSKAALAGSAVTDVIHMLAELIENATTLSPPFTQVRVAGEMVGNGFAIEIEDRGLGMAPQRMAELNERLANPPDINPANTEQLGLFVVGQLARRHGISVTLRPSPYGGVAAVTLIPQRLLVGEGPAALTAGGPGAGALAGAPAGANGMAPGGPNGSYGPPGAYGPPGSYGPPEPFGAAGPAGPAGSPGFAGPPAFGGPPRFVPRGSDDSPSFAGPSGFDDSPGFAAPSRFGDPPGATAPPGFGDSPRVIAPAGFGDSPGVTGPAGFAGPTRFGGPFPGEDATGDPYSGASAPYGSDGGYSGSYGPDGGYGASHGSDHEPATPPAAFAMPPAAPPMPPARSPMPPARSPMAPAGAAGSPPDLDSLPIGPDAYGGTPAGPGGGPHGAPDVPVVTDLPMSRTPVPSSFDVFTPRHRSDGDSPAVPSGPGDAPYAESYQDHGAGSHGTGSPSASPRGDDARGNSGGPDGGTADADGGGNGDYMGLPRRVRQANLAPQLRSSAAAAANGPTGVPRATSASLSDMRNTLSAMQRGWQQGRSQAQPDTEDGADGD